MTSKDGYYSPFLSLPDPQILEEREQEARRK
jgi:hypothetical protein